MNDQKEQQSTINFLNSIKQIIPKHCENCGNKYDPESLKIVKRTDSSTLLHLQCQICKNAYMINVVSPNNTLQGSSRVPINTDLSTVAEVDTFAGKDPVTSEDVLNAHRITKELSNSISFKDLSI